MRQVDSAKFKGSKIKEAREFLGMSTADFATKLGVSKALVVLVENEKREVAPDLASAILSSVPLPASFFFIKREKKDSSGIFYRSRKSESKKKRKSYETIHLWVKDIASYLSEFIVFPKVNIQRFDIDPEKTTKRDIEEIALECRKNLGLGTSPVPNCVDLFERLGIIIYRRSFDAPKIDSFSQWNALDNRPYIALNSDSDNGPRSRFDSCHEFGHLVLHKNVDPERFEKDNAYYKWVEDQAHEFAANFLMPRKCARIEMARPSMSNFLLLKPKWKVSIKFLIHRAKTVGVIDNPRSYQLFMMNYNKKKWHVKEPLNEKVPIEVPGYLTRSFKLLVDRKIKSKQQILNDLPYHAEFIEESLALENGYFEDDLMPILKEDLPNIGDGAKVVEFPSGRRKKAMS